MNADVQSRFDRLDAALSTLIDSLTSYNPSPSAATALVAADDHLASGLDQLTSHQRNHLEIQALRNTADSLDSLLKSRLLQLAETRRELLASSPPSEANTLRQVDHDQLLSYAQQIARFTVPPTYRPPLPPSIDGLAARKLAASDDIRSATTPTPLGTHLAAALDDDPARTAGSTQRPPPLPDSSHLATGLGAEGKAVDALPPAVKAWLEPPSFNMPFMPWPEDENIRRGALGLIEESWAKDIEPSQRNIADEGDASERAEIA